jgi:hypothetical protein
VAAAVAVNAAAAKPTGTVTVAGTATLVLSVWSVTISPSAGAALLNVMLQSLDPGVLTLAGAQVRPVTAAGVIRLTDAVRDCPFQVADTVAVCSTPMTPAVAVNAALPAPAGTDRLGGTLRTGSLLAKLMVIEVAVALVSVTVQVALWPLASTCGAQSSADRRAGATKVSENVWDAPPPVAVTTAL